MLAGRPRYAPGDPGHHTIGDDRIAKRRVRIEDVLRPLLLHCGRPRLVRHLPIRRVHNRQSRPGLDGNHLVVCRLRSLFDVLKERRRRSRHRPVTPARPAARPPTGMEPRPSPRPVSAPAPRTLSSVPQPGPQPAGARSPKRLKMRGIDRSRVDLRSFGSISLSSRRTCYPAAERAADDFRQRTVVIPAEHRMSILAYRVVLWPTCVSIWNV